MAGIATQSEFPQALGQDSREWEFVKSLLQDLQAEEHREELASLFGQWKLSIKAFRRVEERRITRLAPSTLDLKFHKARLCDLMSFGTMLQVAATKHKSEDLAKHGFHKELLDALLRDLHNTFDEWHGQVPDERIVQLSKDIFDASSEPDRRDSRTEVSA
jgi:hypothetical protein